MLKSRLPQIAAQIPGRAEATARLTAQDVEQHARQRVPVDTGALRDSIRVEDRHGIGEFAVIAGNADVDYAVYVEFGTRKMGAEPFMIPAVEVARGNAVTHGLEAMRGL